MEKNSIVVAVIGLDQPGIISTVSAVLTRLDCNIEEMSQSTLHQQFASIYLVNKPAELQNEQVEEEILGAIRAKKLHQSVIIRDFEAPQDMSLYEGEPFVLSVWGKDRNDIVSTFSRMCAEQQINISTLRAFPIEDEQSLQVFEVTIPKSIDTRSLHRVMSERARSMGLRMNMQHRAIFEAVHRVKVE